jgi:hypothetical protein
MTPNTTKEKAECTIAMIAFLNTSSFLYKPHASITSCTGPAAKEATDTSCIYVALTKGYLKRSSLSYHTPCRRHDAPHAWILYRRVSNGTKS